MALTTARMLVIAAKKPAKGVDTIIVIEAAVEQKPISKLVITSKYFHRAGGKGRSCIGRRENCLRGWTIMITLLLRIALPDRHNSTAIILVALSSFFFNLS